MSDAIDLLLQDHRKVEELFSQFEQAGDPDVATTIFEELTIHAMLEEELIYPLYRAKVDTGGADEARNEHQEIKNAIVEAEGAIVSGTTADGSDLASVMQRLKETVRHHVEEEENELFPTMQNSRIGDMVETLGADLVQRKAQLVEQMQSDRSVGMAPSTAGQKPTSTMSSGW